MTQDRYILSYEGECDRLEAQSEIFGHDRGFAMVAPEPGTRLLDAGCGSGWLSRLIARRMPDCTVTGVDINPDYVAFANAKAEDAGLSNLSYRVASLTDLPFADGSFDAIWSMMVLQFLPDRGAALAELARVAAPGGRVIAAQQASTLLRNDPPDPKFDGQIATFLALAFPGYRAEALPALLRAAGLGDVSMTLSTDPLYTFLGPASPAQAWNLRNVIEPALPRLGDFLNDPEASASFADRWVAHAEREDTVTITPFCVAEGRKG